MQVCRVCQGKQEQHGDLAEIPHLFLNSFAQIKLLVPAGALCCITGRCSHPARHEPAWAALLSTPAAFPSLGPPKLLLASADGHSLWGQGVTEHFSPWRIKKNPTRRSCHLQPRPPDILEPWQAREGELQVKERIRSGWLGMGREKEECNEGGREGKAGKWQHSDKFSSESKLQGEGRRFLPQTSELSEILPYREWFTCKKNCKSGGRKREKIEINSSLLFKQSFHLTPLGSNGQAQGHKQRKKKE